MADFHEWLNRIVRRQVDSDTVPVEVVEGEKEIVGKK